LNLKVTYEYINYNFNQIIYTVDQKLTTYVQLSKENLPKSKEIGNKEATDKLKKKTLFN